MYQPTKTQAGKGGWTGRRTSGVVSENRYGRRWIGKFSRNEW